MEREPRLCDYENSTYRTDFWEGQGREYEDLAERIALRHLLPPAGRHLIDIGAGFGRLEEFYGGYEQVVLLDYSRSMLRQTQERLGRSGRFVYVAASFYAIPFVDSAFDAAMMVRVIHHAEDLPAFTDRIARTISTALARPPLDRRDGSLAGALAPFTWKAVFHRVDTLWRRLLEE